MTAGFLTDNTAIAACVLWKSGYFDTSDIASLLSCREDAVCRTLHMARDTAAGRAADRPPATVRRAGAGTPSGSEGDVP